MGLTTVVAVNVFFMVYVPGVWIPFVVLSAAPLVRTYLTAFRARAEGSPLPASEAVLFTLASIGVLTLASVSAVATFYGVCSAVLYGDGSRGKDIEISRFPIGLLMGLVVGVMPLIGITVWFWPKCRRVLSRHASAHRTPRVDE